MIVLNWLAFLIALAVAAVSWGLYTYQPELLLGTPWGPVHVGILLAGSFALGALVMALYALAWWVGLRRTLGRRWRELRQVRSEVENLKRAQVQEIPVIPDRDQQP
ncbi:lipopolysaccharide assembly protein LapA domain-containing protein [Calidithermus chliarophilus]|uniref:lipopolysaccharide assembly protein LapA domain-containing protein n=1 Tax=Calidithermus chliarophilus TaxID=52023 RepID=UPI0004203DFA|nr:LapA family protein [Calidithermus chliarophilus]